jgi:hypothetical protein
MRSSSCFHQASALFSVLALSVLTASAVAQTISQENSWAQWQGLSSDGAAIACPAGDGPSSVSVTVRDADDNPVEGAEVRGHFVTAHCPGGLFGLGHATTNASGVAVLHPESGFEALSTECCSFTFGVLAQFADEPDVAILWNGTNETDQRNWRSFDLNADGVVNGNPSGWGDYGIFMSDWGTTRCRCDYTGDGVVNLSDLTYINLHVLHPALRIDGEWHGFGDVEQDSVYCQESSLQNWGGGALTWQLVEDCPWLTIDPSSGAIAVPTVEPPDPAATQIVDFCINTEGLPPGAYSTGVGVASNSPYPSPGIVVDTIIVQMEVLPPTGVESPLSAYVAQNLPNPFSTATTVAFVVGEPGPVTLRIYDLSGRLVRTLVDRYEAAGRRELAWDGRDEHGADVASGVYCYRLEAPGVLETKRMVLLK